jgi:hypothetical protein
MNTPTPSCFTLSCTECDARYAKLTAERDQLRAKLATERARLERITTALTDAISTYFGADKLVTAERIEAWQAALKEDAK